MWRFGSRGTRQCGVTLRRFHTGARRKIEDEGDWRFAKEWWGDESEGGDIPFLAHSDMGNGVVTVVSHPSSKPERSEWWKTEKWLQERYADVHGVEERFKILKYEWRSLKFNHKTRQSTVKVMCAQAESEPVCLFGMQLPHCLATPYLKSMVSAGLSAISCSGFDLASAVHGNTPMRILCVGHGGGSLPLFLASKIKGAVVDSVEIDPIVIFASKAMGFPSFPLKSSSVCTKRYRLIEKALWKDMQGRLFVHVSDAEDFILNSTNTYDMVFIDAYDGEDIFPSKLWDPQSPFLTALNKQLHPCHGTVVVNLHSDVDVRDNDWSMPSVLQPVLPMGMYVSSVCESYKTVLVGSGGKVSGVVFTVAVPQLCNSSLIASKGFRIGGPVLTRDSVMNTLASKCDELETLLNLPFSCLQYLTFGFDLVD